MRDALAKGGDDRDVEGEFLDAALAARCLRRVASDEAAAAAPTEIMGRFSATPPAAVDVLHAARSARTPSLPPPPSREGDASDAPPPPQPPRDVDTSPRVAAAACAAGAAPRRERPRLEQFAFRAVVDPVAAVRLRGISARHRRPASAEYPRGTRGVAATPPRFAASLEGATTRGFRRRLLRASPATHFLVTDATMGHVAVGCFALGAVVRHSCLPTCNLTYRRPSGKLAR